MRTSDCSFLSQRMCDCIIKDFSLRRVPNITLAKNTSRLPEDAGPMLHTSGRRSLADIDDISQQELIEDYSWPSKASTP